MQYIFWLLSFCCIHLAVADFQVPQLRNHVNDDAGMISASAQNELNHVLSEVKKNTGIEFAILTVPSLEGLEIEQASIKVVDQWKLGTAKDDKGILLMAAAKERKLRIEVGQGLEGTLTDLRSRRIIDYSIVPLMKSGDFNAAFMVGAYKILEAADPTVDFTPYFESSKLAREYSQPPAHSISPRRALIIFIILLIVVLLLSRHVPPGLGPGGRGGYGGHFGGGGFGGGGFGGGGFSGGGGGGFSGGGASGGW